MPKPLCEKSLRGVMLYFERSHEEKEHFKPMKLKQFKPNHFYCCT